MRFLLISLGLCLLLLNSSCKTRKAETTQTSEEKTTPTPVKIPTTSTTIKEDSPIMSYKDFAEREPSAFALVEKIELLIESNAAMEIIEFCHPDNRKTQNDMGIKDQQYLYEIMNIKTQAEETGTYLKDISISMSSLKEVSFESIQSLELDYYREGAYDVFGILSYDSGKKSKMKLKLRKIEGQWWLTGAVG